MKIKFILALAVTALLAGPTQAADERDESVWKALRGQLFGDRAIKDGSELIGVDAPYRAADAALVPIGIEDRRAEGAGPKIAKLYLIVDNNPDPMAGVVEFGPAAASVDVATRIRINAYTHLRAIAETDTGELYMTKRFVKATGGCTAPAGVEEAEALRDLSQMRVRSWASEGDAGKRVQLMIRHPNFSGLQMDQVTRLYRPAHFVDEVRLDYGGERVLRAELTITLSHNPSLRFYVKPKPGAALAVVATDSKDNRFEKTFDTAPQTSKTPTEAERPEA